MKKKKSGYPSKVKSGHVKKQAKNVKYSLDSCHFWNLFVQKNRLSISLFYGIFGGIAFGLQMFRTSFVLTTPSDPLQYVQPALFPKSGFDFIDRTSLWLVLRGVSHLPLPREVVGPVATLTIMFILVSFLSFWLSFRISFVSAGIFVGLAFLNPFYISISTYTYPTQLMTLIIVLTLVITLEFNNLFLSGIGLSFAVLSKIQGAAFGLTLLIFALNRASGIKFRTKFSRIFLGFLSGLVMVLITLFILDGPGLTLRWFRRYFLGGTAATQFAGQNIKGVPQFWQYLFEPIALIAFLGSLGGILILNKKEMFFGIAAILQTSFLILIYEVSQRGGALIHNYSFDAITLGLVAFSAIVGRLLVIKRLSNEILLSLAILLVCLFWSITVADRNLIVGQIVVGKLHAKSSNIAFSGAIILIFAIFAFRSLNRSTEERWTRKRIHKQKLKVTAVTTLSLFLLLVAVGNNVERGYSDSKFKREESLQYHDLAKLIRGLNGKVCVDIKFGSVTNTDAGPRLRGIYMTFYNLNLKNHLFINGTDSDGHRINGSCDYLVTDNNDSKLLKPFGINLSGHSVIVAKSNGKIVSSIDLPLTRVR